MFCICCNPVQPDLPVCFDACSAHAVAPTCSYDEVPDSRTLLGPRQALLESSPCAKCHLRIQANTQSSLVCDGCNAAYHLACLGMKNTPATYWYCTNCTRQLAATGIKEPAEDIAFQLYLLHGKTPSQEHAAYFAALAKHYRYETRTSSNNNMTHEQLQRWIDDRWKDYPSPAERILIMEEQHLLHCHIGGARLHSLLVARYWWPRMLETCVAFTSNCLTC